MARRRPHGWRPRDPRRGSSGARRSRSLPGIRRRRSASRTVRGRAPPTAPLAAARSRRSRLEQTRRVRVQLDRTLATELDRGEPEKALAFRRMRMAMSDAREGQRLNLPREGIGRQQPVERRHPPPRFDLETFDLRRRVRAQHAALDGTWPRVADHAGIVARRGDTPPASDPPFPPRRPSGMAETEPSPGEVRRRPRRISGHHARKEARRRATSGHALPAPDRRPGQSAPQPRQHPELVEPSCARCIQDSTGLLAPVDALQGCHRKESRTGGSGKPGSLVDAFQRAARHRDVQSDRLAKRLQFGKSTLTAPII